MKQILKIILPISIAILIILGLAFYWFEWRPSQIRKECNKQAFDKWGKYGLESYYSYAYQRCLREKGLEK